MIWTALILLIATFGLPDKWRPYSIGIALGLLSFIAVGWWAILVPLSTVALFEVLEPHRTP